MKNFPEEVFNLLLIGRLVSFQISHGGLNLELMGKSYRQMCVKPSVRLLFRDYEWKSDFSDELFHCFGTSGACTLCRTMYQGPK
jgi:hypothetical protein